MLPLEYIPVNSYHHAETSSFLGLLPNTGCHDMQNILHPRKQQRLICMDGLTTPLFSGRLRPSVVNQGIRWVRNSLTLASTWHKHIFSTCISVYVQFEPFIAKWLTLEKKLLLFVLLKYLFPSLVLTTPSMFSPTSLHTFNM